jgi:hypothetical protein
MRGSKLCRPRTVLGLPAAASIAAPSKPSGSRTPRPKDSFAVPKEQSPTLCALAQWLDDWPFEASKHACTACRAAWHHTTDTSVVGRQERSSLGEIVIFVGLAPHRHPRTTFANMPQRMPQQGRSMTRSQGGRRARQGRRCAVSVRSVRDGAPLDRRLRVAVVGGGPAGACAAETLAKGGVETFLIERKMDNCKVCS